MGKVLKQVKKYINMGEIIGCTVATDLLIAGGECCMKRCQLVEEFVWQNC